MDLNQVIYTVFHAEFESGSKIGPKPPQDLIFKDFWKMMFFIKIIIFKKSGFGVVLVQFWIRIRILREKLYILLGSDPFFIDFWKSDFPKIQYFVIFPLSSYISAYFDITIRRALKKHAYCLIFIIFGWS